MALVREMAEVKSVTGRVHKPVKDATYAVFQDDSGATYSRSILGGLLSERILASLARVCSLGLKLWSSFESF